MFKEDLLYLSAIEVLDLYRSHELSPIELLESFIQRADVIDKTINPFADKYFDEARVRAKKSEERYIKGNARRLEGVPLLVKDSSPIKGIRATVGSLSNADKIDQYTDPTVERLMRAGANFFARSTCPEFCWIRMIG